MHATVGEIGVPVAGQQLLESKNHFRRAVRRWYAQEARPLFWRGSRDPYLVWVSEIVLQQTRVEQGTPYIARFLEAFPNVHRLAGAPLDAVLKQWEGLGYYSRARNLHKAAQIIVSEYGGTFPATAAEWQTLPGIGPYTAGAIASIAFDEPAPVLDGNVKRVLARLLDLDTSIDDPAAARLLWKLMAELVRGKEPGAFNQGMMEVGARVCTPRNPVCERCPIQPWCRAFDAGTVAQRPVRNPKAITPHYEIVLAAIHKNGRYLLGKRPPDGLLGGLWEFPGGKVRPGESHTAALQRELQEEAGVAIEVGGLVACVQHAYSHFRTTLNVYKCRHTGGTPRARVHTELKWVTKKAFGNYAFPKANHKFLHLL